MKTFRWTVPEFRPSHVERLEWQKREVRDPDAPSAQEIREFENWQKIESLGVRRYFTRAALWFVAGFSFCLLLAWFDIFVFSIGSTIAASGGVIGGLYSQYLSWKKFQMSPERRKRFQVYLAQVGDN